MNMSSLRKLINNFINTITDGNVAQFVLLLTSLVLAVITISLNIAQKELDDQMVAVQSEIALLETQQKDLKKLVEDRVSYIIQENSQSELYDVYSDEELYLIARVVMAESGNQTIRGKYLVACTIFNRSEMMGIPLSEVVTQPNQYSDPYVFKSGLSEWQREQERNMFDECVEAVKLASEDTEPVIYFFNPETSEPTAMAWIEDNNPYYCVEKDHIFYGDYTWKGVRNNG